MISYTVLSYLYFHFIARTGLVDFFPNRLGANLKIYPQPPTLKSLPLEDSLQGMYITVSLSFPFLKIGILNDSVSK